MDDSKDLTRESFDDIACLPDRWDHNRFYHGYMLRMLPDSGERALDVGCGTGEFTGLMAQRFSEVLGIDLSPRMVEEALKRNPHKRIEYRVGDVEELDLGEYSFDAIVSIAAMHHTDLDVVLPKLRNALKKNGVLVVLDLYRQRTPKEYVLSVLAAPLNLVSGFLVHKGRKPDEWKRLWREHESLDNRVVMTMAQIGGAAEKHLPGVRIRRHLFWRYSLSYVKGEDFSGAAGNGGRC